MKILGTNLIQFMDGNLLAHEVVKTNTTIVEKVVANEILEVKKELDTMINSMYEECKMAKNFDSILEMHAPEIDKINKIISARNVQTKLENGYIRGYWNGIQLFYISLGNGKLVANQHGEGFGIWSIVGKITCNGKTDLCSKNCYNICRSYEKTIKTKLRNAIFTQMDCFVDVMTRTIKKMPYDKTYFRIHEDGDFFNGAYFTKWLEIAKQLENEKVVLMAYTKDTNILPHIKELNETIDNMVLRYSIMEDTEKDVIDYVMANQVPTYICLGNAKKNKDTKKIFNKIALPLRCMDSCKHCKKCYTKHDSLTNIFTKMH